MPASCKGCRVCAHQLCLQSAVTGHQVQDVQALKLTAVTVLPPVPSLINSLFPPGMMQPECHKQKPSAWPVVIHRGSGERCEHGTSQPCCSGDNYGVTTGQPLPQRWLQRGCGCLDPLPPLPGVL